MKGHSPISASPAYFCRARSTFPITLWSRWFSKCRKKSLVKRTVPCSARDALLAPKMCKRRKAHKRKTRTQDLPPASSIINFCTRVSLFCAEIRAYPAQRFLEGTTNSFLHQTLQTLMTKKFPAIFFNRTHPLDASKLFTSHIHQQE